MKDSSSHDDKKELEIVHEIEKDFEIPAENQIRFSTDSNELEIGRVMSKKEEENKLDLSNNDPIAKFNSAPGMRNQNAKGEKQNPIIKTGSTVLKDEDVVFKGENGQQDIFEIKLPKEDGSRRNSKKNTLKEESKDKNSINSD